MLDSLRNVTGAGKRVYKTQTKTEGMEKRNKSKTNKIMQQNEPQQTPSPTAQTPQREQSNNFRGARRVKRSEWEREARQGRPEQDQLDSRALGR